MMNLFKTTILFSTITMAVGCSNLDSSSVFNDVAKNVKERHNYIQVVAKILLLTQKQLWDLIL